MLSYAKLWILLENKGMKKTDLKEVISGNTLAKLGKNETISSAVIEKLCAFLQCQPGDIMEYISEEQIESVMSTIDTINRAFAEQIKEQGISEEQFVSMMTQAMTDMAKGFYQGKSPMTDMYIQAKEENKEN